MLTETLAALAGAAGTGVVTAMVTDGWQQAKTQVARLLGRGTPGKRSARKPAWSAPAKS